jgi:hypothetical protein
LTLFGRPLPPASAEPTVDPLRDAEAGTSDALPGEPASDVTHLAEVQEIVARLRREARADHRLRHVDWDECDRLIEELVYALWATSRVKAFVPLFAMQRLRERLGLSDDTDDGI